MSDFTGDPEQLTVISSPVSARQIVIAPPGSGKTEVVLRRIQYLLDSESLSPDQEILSFSFSRAAIGALKHRAGRNPDLVGASIRTLDSLASEWLADFDDEPPTGMTFDDRIARTLELLKEGLFADALSTVRHLVIDEIQDLVGSRADLALELLAQLEHDAGFTLLGDPLQAVYNFQLTDSQQTSPARFLEKARTIGCVVTRRLSGQYRAQSARTKSAAALGGVELPPTQRIRQLRNFIAEVDMLGDITSMVPALRRWPGSTVILCRDNGLVLHVASLLRSGGTAVTVRADASTLPLSPWLGRVLHGKGRSIDRERWSEACREVEPPMSATKAWRLLKEIERDFRSPDRLDLTALGRKLSFGSAPISLLQPIDGVVISTIHRAKGLEFERALLINPSDWITAEATMDDAAIVFVAVTRARTELFSAACRQPMIRRDSATRRWIIGGHQKWMTNAFEVTPDDVRYRLDAHTDEGTHPSFIGPVTARLNPGLSELDFPVFDILIGATLVAHTTEEFGQIFARRVRPRKSGRPWPVRLEGLLVETLETKVVVNPRGIPEFGVFPRISGLANLVWKE